MWLQVLCGLFVCCYSLGDIIRISKVRTKRQDIPRTDENLAIEFFNNCSCVYYYQCDLDGLIITSGVGLINERVGQNNTKRIKCFGGEFDGQYACCKYVPGDENKPPVTTSTTTESLWPSTRTEVTKKSCGKQLPNINVRVFHDEEELTPVIGEFPWLAAIFKTHSSKWKFHGSGSLIHPRVILTANHHFVSTKAANLKVIVNGQIELSQIGDEPVEERNVKEIIKHPKYSSGSLYNDVALLILEEPYNITYTLGVNTLCLKPDLPFENKRCIVAGWGKTPTSDGSIKVLKKVDLPTLTHSKCQELLRNALDREDFDFHESFMCAGGEEGKDACKGDGGSPLMCPTGANNSMYQVGIVSWGIGCGKKDIPGVYTNVGFLHTWIVDQLKQRDIEIDRS